MGGLLAKFRGSRSRSDKAKSKTQESAKRPKQEKKSKSQKQKKTVDLPESQSARKIVDPRLPFSNYRQIFSIRNAWKAVARSMEDCAKETLIRLFHKYPNYQARFPSVKEMTDEEEMRHNEEFETAAMDIFQVFDDVIANLEEVDKALRDIQNGAPNVNLTKTMFKNMQDPFIETIRFTLGPERFPETTENNFKLLYEFVNGEINKYLDDDPVEEEEEEENKPTEEDPTVTETDVEINLRSEDGV